jgi:hypothetical protein
MYKKHKNDVQGSEEEDKYQKIVSFLTLTKKKIKKYFFPDSGSSDNFTEFSNNDIEKSITQNDDEQAPTSREPTGSIFRLIISLEEFFYDDPNTPWEPLPEHTLEQSPCYPVISRDKNNRPSLRIDITILETPTDNGRIIQLR